MTTEPTTIPDLLARQARHYPSAIAIIDPAVPPLEFGTASAQAGTATEMTYAELHAAAVEVTRAVIACGVVEGDRVAIWAPNGSRWIATALGLLGAGATLVPIGTRLQGREAAAMLRRTRCRALFTVRGFLGIDYPSLLAGQGVLPDLRFTVLLSDSIPAQCSARTDNTMPSPDAGQTQRYRDRTYSTGPQRPRITADSPDEQLDHHMGFPHPAGKPGSDTSSTTPISWAQFIAAAHDSEPELSGTSGATPSPESISDIMFTSGTTGAPKGVLTTHRQTLMVMDRWASVVTLRHGDRYLLVNPFSHSFGYKAGVVACLLRAATMVPVDRFDPEGVAEVMDSAQITVLAGPPTVFTDLLAVGRSFRTLRLAGTGGAAIPPELIERIRGQLGADRVFTAYGLTESVGVVAICPPEASTEQTANTVGIPLPGSEIRLLDQAGRVVPPGESGEIVVRGPNVMRGYLDDPEATAAAVDHDGRLRTGDIGTFGADGFLRITGRATDMFIVGGFNVYPAEVEHTLRLLPGIDDVAVIGVPDERLGEVGAAFVVPTDPASFDPREVLDRCREHLAGYKVPRTLRIVDLVPRNVTGKVRKSELRRKYT